MWASCKSDASGSRKSHMADANASCIAEEHLHPLPQLVDSTPEDEELPMPVVSLNCMIQRQSYLLGQRLH